MTISTENRPLCECHNIVMYWKVDNRKRSGGYWQCRIKRRKFLSNWRKNSESYKIKHRRDQKKYQDSVKGYITTRKRELNKMREENLLRLEALQEELNVS